MGMWFTPEAIARLQNALSGHPLDANDVQKRVAAEKAVEASGSGVCSACAEEIVKNTLLGYWESDFLLGYCYEAKDRKHRPLIRYTPEDGVTNVEGDNPAHSEPLPDSGQRD